MPAGILSRFDERSTIVRSLKYSTKPPLLLREAPRIEQTIGFFSESNEVCPYASRLGLISDLKNRFGKSAITDYAYRIDLIASFERNVMLSSLLFLVSAFLSLPPASPCLMLALVKISRNLAGCSSRMRLDFRRVHRRAIAN